MLYAALLLYDKLSSLSPSDMCDRSVRHVRFGCIRAIVPGIRITIPGTRRIVPNTQTIVPGTDPKFIRCIDLVLLD
jgi:hypothetical protein